MRFEILGMLFLFLSYYSFGLHYTAKSVLVDRLLMGFGWLMMFLTLGCVFLLFL
jgi:hypothetical protein